MAVRAFTEIEHGWDKDATKVYEWAGLLNTDTGAPVHVPLHADITVQALGTLGTGGVVTIEGTLDTVEVPPTASYGILQKPDSTPLTLTAIGMIRQALEHPVQIRPNITAGDGATNFTVRLICTKSWKH